MSESSGRSGDGAGLTGDDEDPRADQYSDYRGVALELGEFAPEFDLAGFFVRRSFSQWFTLEKVD